MYFSFVCLHVCLSVWYDLGCRHPNSIRCCGTSSMQQVLSFSLPLSSPPAPLKVARKHLDSTIAALPTKLKQSLTWWPVHWSSDWWVFSLLKKEREGARCEFERRYAAKSWSLICKSPQAYLMHFWKAANVVENPVLSLVSRWNSSLLNHILPALSLHFQLERVLFLQTSCPKSLGTCLLCNTEHGCCSTNRWLKWFTNPVAEALWDTPEYKAATEAHFFPSYCGEETVPS